jgi:hypothetical protein
LLYRSTKLYMLRSNRSLTHISFDQYLSATPMTVAHPDKVGKSIAGALETDPNSMGSSR